MSNVNNKILWVSDFDLDQAPGGAQRSDQLLIDKGRLLGLNIKKVNHETYKDIYTIHDYDLVVSTNICALYQKYPDLIQDLHNHRNHVRLEHDSNTYLKQEDRIALFSGCSKTIFLSEYHHSFFKELYGDIFKNVEIIYDPIDTNLFYDRNQDREDKILYVGYMHPLKGTSEFFEYALANPDKKFVIAGFTDQRIYHFMAHTVPNIEYLGLKSYEEMPDIYNKYVQMFYKPVCREPFCRSAAEAICCGVQLIGDPRHIGCLHEVQKVGIDKFREKCNSAASDFWSTIL